MNVKELCAKLAGATYDNFIRSDALIKQVEAGSQQSLEAEAKQNGLVVVFGASDDLMEFRGAIHDELGAYNGTTAYVDAKGLLPDRDSIEGDDELKDYFARQPHAKPIEALWDSGEGYSWKFKTDIPHETFEVTEDGEPYCRGIVFALADVTAPL